MFTGAIVEALVAAGRAEDFAAVDAIDGAGVHARVLRFSDTLRRSGLAEIEALSVRDRAAFVKALAVYENTVGGLGSVTALERLLALVQDDDHAILDWILSTTRSYWYYSGGAKSFAELQAVRATHAERRVQNEQREAERERLAKQRKAHRASRNLFNAVRRGDSKAVEALLLQGADSYGATPSGVPLAQYAETSGRADIAELVRQAQGGDTDLNPT